MKIIVVVPSAEYRSSAGARVRYGRLAEGIAATGADLVLEKIADFDPATADCDVVIISKCHDARSLITAATMSARGKLVGVDLFDDYFSQEGDSRLLAYRQWLTALLKNCHFCLCSTEALAKVAQRYRPGIPVHVVNDPAPEHDSEAATRLAESKLADALKQGVIRATWFGVGDNPYFQVGLADLFVHALALNALAKSGMSVQLTVVTNRRSLDADGLEIIARLPVETTVCEWSTRVERQVLDESLIAFLPVAAQPFSAAKSLNRAFTALAHGCQVLSVGFPLYRVLAPLIYSDPADLVTDLGKEALRFSPSSLSAYREKLEQFGSAETEALRLREFLGAQHRKGGKPPPRLCVIHGLATRAEVHSLTKEIGALSVAGPWCAAHLDFDVVYRGVPPHLHMIVASDEGETASGLAKRLTGPVTAALSKAPAGSFPYQLTTYAASVSEMKRMLRERFGALQLILSDTSRVPVALPVDF